MKDKYKKVRSSNGKIPFLIIERLDISIPTGEKFSVFEENIKLTFPGTEQIHDSIPIWVIEEAIKRYCNDPTICTRYAS